MKEEGVTEVLIAQLILKSWNGRLEAGRKGLSTEESVVKSVVEILVQCFDHCAGVAHRNMKAFHETARVVRAADLEGHVGRSGT